MSVITPLAQNGFVSMFNTPLGIYYAVECVEEFPFNDMERQQSVAQGFAGLENFLPTPADPSICAAWNAEPVNASFREPAAGDVPALVLSGEYDAVTPAMFSQQTASRLENAVYINIPGLSHSVMDVDACARQMAAAFIDSPETFSTTICQPGNEALEFITEKNVMTTSVVYFAATKIHSAAVVVIPVGIAFFFIYWIVDCLEKTSECITDCGNRFSDHFLRGYGVGFDERRPDFAWFRSSVSDVVDWASIGNGLVCFLGESNQKTCCNHWQAGC